MTKRAFGELESQILYLMSSGKRKTVKDIHQELGGQDNYNTVMTVMSRLATKNQLIREKVEMHYEYWLPAAEKPSTSFLEKLKHKLFGEKTSVLVSYLIESADDLDEKDLVEMETMIQKRRALKK